MNRRTKKALEVLRWQSSDGREFDGRAVAPGQDMRPIAHVRAIGYASEKGRERAIWSHEHDTHALPILARGPGRGAVSPIYQEGEPWLLLGRLTDLVVAGADGDRRLILPPLLLCTQDACTTAAGGPLIFVAEAGTTLFALCPVYNDKRRRFTPFVTGRGIEG